MAVISVRKGKRQENYKFMVSLGYIVTPRILSEKRREEGKRERGAMARKKGKLGRGKDIEVAPDRPS